jgi:predicted SAM-dependent methyltransferase
MFQLKELFKKATPVATFYWFGRKMLWRLKRQLAYRNYFIKHQVRKLQIGCNGNILEGWFNVDLLPFYKGAFFLNATKTFPFLDDSFDYVFSEHMIEHVRYDSALFMLHECYRILKPGGKIRISTPDLETLANLYAQQKSQEQISYIKSVTDLYLPHIGEYQACFVVNQLFKFGHEFLYDFSTLKLILSKIGFTNITRCVAGASCEKEFQGVDCHVRDYISFESLVVEAILPLEKANLSYSQHNFSSQL